MEALLGCLQRIPLEEEERSPKLINDNSIIIDRILDMTETQL